MPCHLCSFGQGRQHQSTLRKGVERRCLNDTAAGQSLPGPGLSWLMAKKNVEPLILFEGQKLTRQAYSVCLITSCSPPETGRVVEWLQVERGLQDLGSDPYLAPWVTLGQVHSLSLTYLAGWVVVGRWEGWSWPGGVGGKRICCPRQLPPSAQCQGRPHNPRLGSNRTLFPKGAGGDPSKREGMCLW